MEIKEVDLKEYNQWIKNPYHIFGSGDFTDINSKKIENVYYLLFNDGKVRLGITGGIRESIFFSPFSAPFGGFMHLREDVKINQIDNACIALTLWAKTKGLRSIEIKLPPPIYNKGFISKQINTLFRNNFIIANIELNYSYHTTNFDDNYASTIWYNARRNLNLGIKNNLKLHLCINTEQKKIAYTIIQHNRATRGFPLRMTWEQIDETIKLIHTDFFLCFDQYRSPIASAIALHVSKDIIQIIYWGDLPEFNRLKTMNFLSYKIFEYYKTVGIKIIDIGPATENSAPNYGLCEFKESIGCQISTKLHFKKIIYED